ncbi:MAG: nicotinate-nucleotide adenylyltransferase [Clostridiales bacterium]|nr:nicotinate-nucleotide adenylyltransferase [Clostridiales bacterium]
MSDTDRIGVLGGSFDPVHMGHLGLADAARARAGLCQVLFMPACVQPFKQGAEMSSADDRLRMLGLALEGRPHFGVTEVEIERGGVSYTIDSLRALSAGLFGGRGAAQTAGRDDARLCFIIGTDMFLMIEKWKDADALLREFDFAVGVRPGYRHGEAVALAGRLREEYGTRIDLVDNPPLELSSSEIRERVRSGGDICGLVPEGVRRFLLVREKVGERRFSHTKRVIDLAVDMARRFGESVEKAGLAALLHDYCKDPTGGAENDLAHGGMAADTAERIFGIDDEDVLNAIRFHTTGRAGMSRLEKIIFLADTVEPGRTYNSIAELRETCLDDLDRGTLTVLVELKKYLEQKGLAVSADTEAAIEDLRK